MKIAFIRPSMLGGQSKDGMTPLIFAIIKPLTPPDIDIVFYDERVEPLPENFDADAVAMTVETFAARRAYKLALKYHAEGKKVIMGGFHPTMLPDECLKYADTVITGEAEDTWAQVVNDLKSGTLKRIYKSNGKCNLSECKLDYSVFKGKKYHPIGLVQFSRGCRYACDFCSIHAFYGSNIRCKSIDCIIGEIRSMKEKYIFFIDDNIFSDKKAAKELFTALVPLKKKWFCQISMDIAKDKEILALMKKSGCMVVLIGFESLDIENLKQMGKGANIEYQDYETVIENIYDAGIMIYGTFVIGYDKDTAQTAGKLCDFALEHHFAIANFNPLMPMPGTRLLDRLNAENRLTYDKWWINPDYRYGDAMLKPKGMSEAELTESCKNARFKFNTAGNIRKRLFGGKSNRHGFGNIGIYLLANIVSRAEIHAKQGKQLGGEDEKAQ